MTTKVTITTHGWPVRVVFIDSYAGNDPTISAIRVPPNSSRDVHLTSSRQILTHEIQPHEADYPEDANVSYENGWPIAKAHPAAAVLGAKPEEAAPAA